MQFRLGKKLDKKDKDLNFGSIKSEIGQSIKDDEHYTNVDNAKKLAVHQGMDYENFRQMVLGADLKPMKTKEVQTLTSIQTLKRDNIIKTSSLSHINVDVGDKRADLNVKSKIVDIRSFKDFKKIIDSMKKPLDNGIIELIVISVKNNEKLNKIVSIDFDAQYLMKLIKLLGDEEDYQKIIHEILLNFSKTKNFRNLVKQMLSKSEKAYIKKVILRDNDNDKEIVDKLLEAFVN